MCSVVGYIGTRTSREIVLDGLSRLEYRGYDSSGFVCIDPITTQLVHAKTVGPLDNLKNIFAVTPIDGAVGIGHTRWSTHGVVNEENAHPHFDCQKTVSIVHNGGIENYTQLRTMLIGHGHFFASQTDSEVIAHLLEHELSLHDDLFNVVRSVVNQLQGVYAFIAIIKKFPDVVVVVRKGCPLCIGMGSGEKFIASDILAFAGKTDQVVFMPEESFGFVTAASVELFSFAGLPLVYESKKLDAQWVVSAKDGHEHYMLKEIYEQKAVVQRSVVAYRALSDIIWKESGLTVEFIRSLKKIVIVGCGTSWHAGRMAEFFFDEIVGISTTAALASEFRYRTFFPQKDALYIAVSQSGETADTLDAIRFLKDHGCVTFALTNVASSTLVRECDGFLLTHAGPEVAVASTKAFTGQIASFYWLANRMALERNLITQELFKKAEDDLLYAGYLLEEIMELAKNHIVAQVAPWYAQFDRTIFLGRHISYPFALEAALKLKEIAYIFSQAYPAGELKHGPLALVDDKTPVCIFSHPDPLIYQKLLLNAQAVKSRQGKLVIFAFEGQDELISLADHLFVLPKVSSHLSIVALTGIMQLMVYHIARIRGCSIDRPRNLAKSVTVQ